MFLLIEFEASRETVAWPKIPETLVKEAVRPSSVSSVSSQADWKWDVLHLRCVEEHGSETP